MAHEHGLLEPKLIEDGQQVSGMHRDPVGRRQSVARAPTAQIGRNQARPLSERPGDWHPRPAVGRDPMHGDEDRCAGGSGSEPEGSQRPATDTDSERVDPDPIDHC